MLVTSSLLKMVVVLKYAASIMEIAAYLPGVTYVPRLPLTKAVPGLERLVPEGEGATP